MGIMDFLDSIDKILPFFFFIIWIVFGALARKKKVPPSQTGKPPSRPKPKSGGGLRELRKTLQKVLEEMQAPIEPQQQESTTTLESLFDDTVSPEMPPSPIAPVREIKASSSAVPQMQAPAPKSMKKNRTAFNPATVRQGVIWSEILAPPIGLRD